MTSKVGSERASEDGHVSDDGDEGDASVAALLTPGPPAPATPPLPAPAEPPPDVANVMIEEEAAAFFDEDSVWKIRVASEDQPLGRLFSRRTPSQAIRHASMHSNTKQKQALDSSRFE